jgi:hypothetical protein
VGIRACGARLIEPKLDFRVSSCAEIPYRNSNTSTSTDSWLFPYKLDGRVFRVRLNSIDLSWQQFVVCAGRKQSIRQVLMTPVGLVGIEQSANLARSQAKRDFLERPF